MSKESEGPQIDDEAWKAEMTAQSRRRVSFHDQTHWSIRGSLDLCLAYILYCSDGSGY